MNQITLHIPEVQDDFSNKYNFQWKSASGDEGLDIICAYCEAVGIPQIIERPEEGRLVIQKQLASILSKSYDVGNPNGMIRNISDSYGRDFEEVLILSRGLNILLHNGLSPEQMRKQAERQKSGEPYSDKSKEFAIYSVDHEGEFTFHRPPSTESKYDEIIHRLRSLPRMHKVNGKETPLTAEVLEKAGGNKALVRWKLKNKKGEVRLDLNAKFLSGILQRTKAESRAGRVQEENWNIALRDSEFAPGFQDFLAAARRMDACAQKNGHKKKLSMEERLLKEECRQFFVRKGTDGRPVDKVEFDTITHIVGQTGAGKSTLMQISAFMLVEQGKKVGFILPDNSTLGRSIYDDLITYLKPGQVAFLTGSNSKSLYENEMKLHSRNSRRDPFELLSSEPTQDIVSSCVLAGCVENLEDLTRALTGDGRNDPKSFVDGCKDIYVGEAGTSEKKGSFHTCPFVGQCGPYQEFMKVDRGEAQVLITTPYALQSSKFPDILARTHGEERFVPYHLHELGKCSHIFVDEGDMVQAIMDDRSIEKSDIIGSDEVIELQIASVLQAYHWKYRSNSHPEIEETYIQMSGHLGRVASLDMVALQKVVDEGGPDSAEADGIIKKILRMKVTGLDFLRRLVRVYYPLGGDASDQDWENHFLRMSPYYVMNLRRIQDGFKTVALAKCSQSAEQMEALRDDPTLDLLARFLDSPGVIANEAMLSKILDLALDGIPGQRVRHPLTFEVRATIYNLAVVSATQVFHKWMVQAAQNLSGERLNKAAALVGGGSKNDITKFVSSRQVSNTLTSSPADHARHHLVVRQREDVDDIYGRAFTVTATRHLHSLRTLLDRLPYLGGSHAGPKIIYLSGTSTLEASVRYHVQREPKYIITRSLEPSTSNPPLTFELYPVLDAQGNPLSVSGSRSPRERTQNLLQMASLSCMPRGSTYIGRRHASFHDEHGQSNRKIAIVVSSYEAQFEISQTLSNADGTKKIAVVITHAAESKDSYGYIESMKKNQRIILVHTDNLQKLGELHGKYEKIIIVMGSLSRGVNIMLGDEPLIGTFFCPIRFHPPLGDHSLHTSLAGHYSQKISALPVKDRLKWEEQRRALQREHADLSDRLIEHDGSLLRHDHKLLQQAFAADRLVELQQMIGRGTRNGGKVLVLLGDAAFAPRSVRDGEDSSDTSILVDWIEILREQQNANVFAHNEIYDPVLAALESTRGLRIKGK